MDDKLKIYLVYEMLRERRDMVNVSSENIFSLMYEVRNLISSSSEINEMYKEGFKSEFGGSDQYPFDGDSNLFFLNDINRLLRLINQKYHFE